MSLVVLGHGRPEGEQQLKESKGVKRKYKKCESIN